MRHRPGGLSAGSAGLIASTVAAVAQLAPLVHPGYVLLRDLTFVPTMPLTGRLLGADGVPRAVPSDLLLALASRVVSAALVERGVLLGIVILAGWGAARLVPRSHARGGVAAALALSWNPYVSERLLLGQWALLLGYAAMPWVVGAVLRLRRDGLTTAGLGALGVAVGLGAAGGVEAELVAILPALCVAVWPHARGARPSVAAALLGMGALQGLPWLVAAIVGPVRASDDPGGVALFASRADTPFGALGSLLTGGGAWDADTALPGRSALGPAAAALLVAVISLVALWRAGRRPVAVAGIPRDLAGGLLLAGCLGFALAAASSVPVGAAIMRAVVGQVPGGALLRDAQKWVAPLVLAEAVGLALAVAEMGELVAVARQAVRRSGPVGLAGTLRVTRLLLGLAPVLLLPVAAGGVAGRLQPVRWPAAWAQVRAAGARFPTPGPVLVLPWSAYRSYPWNDGRTQLDPAERWLARRTIADDRLQVGQGRTRYEDPVAAAVAPVALGSAPLAPALAGTGIPLVLVERTAPGGVEAEARTAGLTVLLRTADLELLAVPLSRPRSTGTGPTPGPVAPVRAAVGPLLAADGLSGLTALSCLGICALFWVGQRRGHACR